MKRYFFCFAGLFLSGALLMHGALSIELIGAPLTPATSVGSASSPSGTVTQIDAKGGWLVLDRARRFSFAPGGVRVRSQNGAFGNLVEVKVGVKVRLTVTHGADTESPRVAEVLIAK